MFDKKYKIFPNGKIFYMIDKDKHEIRKTKIYGYQFTKKGSFAVLAKMQHWKLGAISKGTKLAKVWEYEKPSRFHKSLKDAILFAKIEIKNSDEARIKRHEEEISKRKKLIEERKEKINSITDDTIIVKEGVFDDYSPDTTRGYL